MIRSSDKKQYEKKRAKKLGVQLNNGSGAVSDDADFRWENFLIEHKFRTKNTIAIDINWWKKVKKQAIFRNRIPGIIFENNECNVIYFAEGDVFLDNYALEIESIDSFRSIWLQNIHFQNRDIKAQEEGKVFIIKYLPENLLIMDADEFKKIIEQDQLDFQNK